MTYCGLTPLNSWLVCARNALARVGRGLVTHVVDGPHGTGQPVGDEPRTAQLPAPRPVDDQAADSVQPAGDSTGTTRLLIVESATIPLRQRLTAAGPGRPAAWREKTLVHSEPLEPAPPASASPAPGAAVSGAAVSGAAVSGAAVSGSLRDGTTASLRDGTTAEVAEPAGAEGDGSAPAATGLAGTGLAGTGTGLAATGSGATISLPQPRAAPAASPPPAPGPDLQPAGPAAEPAGGARSCPFPRGTTRSTGTSGAARGSSPSHRRPVSRCSCSARPG